jgi:peptide/nickel transport system permease protein
MKSRISKYNLRLPGWSENTFARLAWRILFVISFFAVLGPLFVNEKPYYCRLDGKSYFPLFTSVTESGLSAAHPSYSPVDWNSTAFERVWRTPVPYSYQTIDLKTGALISPFEKQALPLSQRHWLGTDAIGHDVFAAMIRGCRISLLIGLGSMLLALCIGLFLGSVAAYWGNQHARISGVQLWILLFGLIGMVWIGLLPIAATFRFLLVICAATICGFLLYAAKDRFRNTVAVPFDQLLVGAVSVIDGFPAMFLVVVIVALLPIKGWFVIMLVIALLQWPSMARYSRAEVFKLRESNFIKAAQVMNLPASWILGKHILPFALRPVMVAFIFGVATAISQESTLSFLGIGLPIEEMNWGKLLAQSRSHFDAWWLMVFPGSAIFLTLLSLYVIGNAIQRRLEARY